MSILALLDYPCFKVGIFIAIVQTMDPLSDILTLLRPADYGFRGLDAAGDWALDFAPDEGIYCFAIEAGECWLGRAGDSTPVMLATGDVVLLAGDQALRLFSSPGAPAIDAVEFLSSVPPGQVATLNGGGACRGVGGYFDLQGFHADMLLAALPPLVHVRSAASKAALLAGVQRLMRELSAPRPGSALLASHLAQALLIEALRAHLEGGQASGGWLAALGDPPIHRALVAMHGDVARRWVLGDLARVAGMSRSSFAARFAQVTGETPIAYLARWRMVLAADRLARSGMALADVAGSVGYESESAFGAAFKRVMGRSPRGATPVDKAAVPLS